MKKEFKAEDCCGSKRPPRKVLCQLKKGHKGSCRAVIYWEEEFNKKELEEIKARGNY